MTSQQIEYWLAIGLVVTGLAGWVWIGRRSLQQKPILESVPYSSFPWRAEMVLPGLALFLLLPGLLAPLLVSQSVLLRLLDLSFIQAVSAALVAILLLPIRIRQQEKLDVQIESNWLKNCMIGLVSFVLWVPVVLGIQYLLTFWFPYEHSTIDILNSSDQVDSRLVALITFFSAAICAPIAEEFFFRWIVQAWMITVWFKFILPMKQGVTDTGTKRRPICWPAIFIPAILFACLHLGQGPAPIALFVLALGIGYVFDRTGSLLACIVIHFLLNAMTMGILILKLFEGS